MHYKLANCIFGGSSYSKKRELTNRLKNTDQENVILLQQGDRASFNTLFSRYGSRLLIFAYGYLKCKEDAEEVVQEVFLKVWRNRKNLNPELSFKAYIFKIAYNLTVEIFNNNSKQNFYKEDLIEEVIDDRIDLIDQLNYQMLLDKVELFIEKLPKRQREVLIFKRKEGYSIKEIATKLSISHKTVENHLTESIKQLKREFIDLDF